MTDKLPPNLLALFAPRPPLRYLPPSDRAANERITHRIDGCASYIAALKAKEANAKASERREIAPDEPTYEAPPTESHLEKTNRLKYETADYQKYLVSQGWKEKYKPHEQLPQDLKGDAYKTIFIGASQLPGRREGPAAGLWAVWPHRAGARDTRTGASEDGEGAEE